MRSAIIFFLLLLQSSCFYAQIHLNILPKRPYEPLIFKDLKPIWYETLYDPAFIGGDTCNGYNLFKRSHDIQELFDEEYVYKIFIKRGVFQHNGTWLEKRNIKSGKQEWMTYYGLPLDERQEFGRLLSFDHAGNIEVLSQYKITAYKDISDKSFGYQTVLSKRVYDKYTGKLLEYVEPDTGDTSLIQSKFSIWINDDNFYKISTDSFRYFHLRFESLSKGYYCVSKIHIKSTNHDTIQYSLAMKERISLIPFAPISDDEILIVERTGTRLLLRYTDMQLNIKNEYYTDSISNFTNRILFESYDPVHETLLITHSEDTNPDGTPEQREIILLNKEGKILKRGKLPGRYGGSFGILSGNNHKNIKLIASENVFPSSKEINVFLDILHMEEDGTLKRYKRYTPVDSVRFISLFKIFHVLDNKILMSWWERSYSNDNGQPHFDTKSSAMSWVLFDASEFGITTATEYVSDYKATIYPNPVRDEICIDFVQPVEGTIKLYDEKGFFYHKQKIDNESITKMDVSHLRPGFYYLYLQTAKNNMLVPLQKIIKI